MREKPFVTSWYLLVLASMFALACVGFWQGRVATEHNIAAHFYHHCREDLGLFEPMTILEKGRSACAARIETELGIENRWTEELP